VKTLSYFLVISISGLGLVLGGCGGGDVPADPVFESAATRLGDPVTATVNGTTLYQSDLDRMAEEQGWIDEGGTLLPSDPRYTQLLDELIDQRLLALDALTRGIDQDPDTKRRLQAARERILGNIRVETYLRDAVTPATIRRMYEENAKLAAQGNEVRARHILVETKAEAEALRVRLVAGEDFVALAREYSLDAGSREEGGNLAYFTKDMLSPDFTRAVFAISEGELTPVFKTDYGWHIAEVQDIRPVTQPNFETMRPEIANFMTFEAIQTLLKDLRETAEIETTIPRAPILSEDDSQADATSEMEQETP